MHMVKKLFTSGFPPFQCTCFSLFEFTLEIELIKSEDAPYDEPDVFIEIENKFGYFSGRGEFFVF